jgi:pilus assembly protein Flp/PilA
MKVLSSIKSFIQDEEGASALEYAVIAAMVAVFIVTLTPGIQNALKNIFGKIQTALGG